MSILLEELLTIKNEISALKQENEKETYTTRYFANKARIEELEVAEAWTQAKIAQGQWGDERSYLI